MTDIVIPENSTLYQALHDLAQNADMVFFSGLPGVGKSLFLQQLALMAQHNGRSVHLIQWDISRSAFETPDMLAKYPEIEGVTHAMIRKAAGLWAREAVVDWSNIHPQPEHLLIGEVPLVGNRLLELAKPHVDDSEVLLRHKRTKFVLPVPSTGVRQAIVAKREDTIADPQHEKETRDAPPNVLRDLWSELYHLAIELDLVDAAPQENPPYQPHIYRAIYEHLLRFRNAVTIPVETVLAPSGSVYDLDNVVSELAATPERVQQIMMQLEADSTIDAVERDVAGWYRI